MARMWKSIFGGKGADKSASPRVLDHPRDLQQGDIIKFKFMPQADLSNKQFQVIGINTYDFEDRHQTEFTLSGEAGDDIHMIVDESDDAPVLTFSIKVDRSLVGRIFDIDEFAGIFDGDGHAVLKCHLDQNVPDPLSGWMAKLYRQEVQAEDGYYHKGDYRGRSLPEGEEEGDSLEYYRLVSDDREYLVEAEVYEGGETDVLITIRRPLSDIEEMWPAHAQ